ncbi:Glutamate receptor ionotropic, NMDA 2B [Homalodisca vitripennis]|nr:Glutamate receptor ionotropic, NMDA 2B [Homalodisca vitripennis]
MPDDSFGRVLEIRQYVNGPDLANGMQKQYNSLPPPTPTDIVVNWITDAILNSLCKEFLNVNVSAILYLMNYEKYGRSTASAQYFLQLAGYLGIPVIAWNADNSGLERRASQSSLQLQLAPSLEHQTAAMLSILERYKWHRFSIVTSQIAGHDDFIQAIRERISDMQDRFKLTAATLGEGSGIPVLQAYLQRARGTSDVTSPLTRTVGYRPREPRLTFF